MAGMLILFFITQQRTILTEELKKRGIALTRNLAYNCEYGVITEDGLILSELIEGIKKNQDISYAVVFNKEGKVLAASSEESILQQFPGKNSLKNGEVKIQYHVFEETGPVLDIAVPIVIQEQIILEDEDWFIGDRQEKNISTGKAKDREKAAIGLVRVGISLKNTNAAINRNRNRSISAIAVVSIASGIIFSVLLVMIVIRPLHKFRQGANAISKGDFNYHIDINSSDEIGILAESFNAMTKELKEKNEMLEKASKELREYSESLEKIVKLRTHELEGKTKDLENEVAVRKQAEKKLRTEKAYIDQLFESAQEAIVMADKNGRVLRVNSEFIRLFGYTIDELVRSSLDDLIAPKEHYDSAVATTKKVTEGKKIAFETVRQRKNGTLLNASVLASPIIVDGELVAVYGIYRDITALKRAEKALEERSKELAEANIRLKELDRLKSMFIASMSHELRTPLNSIIGFTGIILQGLVGEINEEQRKQLALVKNSANHLLALINDVIDVSKIEADQIELVIEEYDLADLIQEVNDSFKVALEEKGLKLSLEMPERLTIKSDERRTKQVFMNLVSNAVKFTDKGEIKIKVAKKDERVEISVRDTGIGIEKKTMNKLFKAFSRIYTKDTLKEGTGLGLYLSRKMANLLGGELSAKSEFGKGSKFTFTLPLKFKEEQRNEKNTGG
jgi:PAS domain S-box-containing protein